MTLDGMIVAAISRWKERRSTNVYATRSQKGGHDEYI